MKIRQLVMENFRAFEGQAFTFERDRTIVIGGHGKGKSTTFDAIRWVLSGVCRGTDSAGRGMEKLVRFGTEAGVPMTVSLEVEHKGETKLLTRTFDGTNANFNATGFHGPSTAQAQALLDWLGVSREVLQAILDGEKFFALGHADAKALLLALLPCEIVVPGEKPETITLEVCDQRYTKAFEGRKTAKVRLKDKPALQPPATPAGDIAGTIAKIQEIRGERDVLVAKRAEAQGVAKGGAKTKQREVERLTIALANLQSSRLASVVEGVETVEAATGKAQACQTVADKAQADIARLAEAGPAEKASGGKSYDDLVRQALALREFDPKTGCVLSRDVTCPQKASQFTVAAKAVEKDAAAIKAAHEARVARESGLKAAEDLSAKASMEQAVWKGRAEKLARFDVEIEQTEADLAAAKGELGESAPVAEAGVASPFDAEIAALDERIKKGQAILADKQARQARQDQCDARVVERKKLDVEIAKWEAEVEMYGPSGIRVSALAGALESFQATVNQALTPFGYTLTVEVEPWGVVVNGLPYVMLSASEQWRVAIALQCAMAEVSGLGFTLVDQVDMLLPSARAILTKLLVMPGGLPLGQVILARAHEGDASAFQGLSDRGVIEVISL